MLKNVVFEFDVSICCCPIRIWKPTILASTSEIEIKCTKCGQKLIVPLKGLGVDFKVLSEEKNKSLYGFWPTDKTVVSESGGDPPWKRNT